MYRLGEIVGDTHKIVGKIDVAIAFDLNDKLTSIWAYTKETPPHSAATRSTIGISSSSAFKTAIELSPIYRR